MQDITEEEKYWLWLASVEGIGPVRFYHVLNTFTDIKSAWENCTEITRCVKGINEKMGAKLCERANDAFIERFLKFLAHKNINVLTRLNQDYPKTLAEIENPPTVLYYKGTLPDFDDMSCAVVGSRKPTKNGFQAAKNISMELAAQGVVIVSGMARGIDTAAHTGALEGGGKTVAVLGSGVDVVYPAENRKLYDQIVESGAVISEFLPGMEPKASNFPQRNRIVAGLSKALISGEGGEKSGARITVDFALKQGREVYTLACNLSSPVAKLPLYLMESGAPTVQKATEVMSDLGWEINLDCLKEKDGNNTIKLDLLETQIYNLLLKEDLAPEEISAETGRPMREINTLLTLMELRGLIEGIPGDKFRVNS